MELVLIAVAVVLGGLFLWLVVGVALASLGFPMETNRGRAKREALRVQMLENEARHALALEKEKERLRDLE